MHIIYAISMHNWIPLEHFILCFTGNGYGLLTLFGNLFGNLFGYLPAPYVYGVFTDLFNDKGQKGMIFTMWYSIVGVILIVLAAFYRYKGWEDKNKYEELNDNDGLIIENDNKNLEMMNEQLLEK